MQQKIMENLTTWLQMTFIKNPAIANITMKYTQ
jgi:hypothetical protein